MFDLYNKIFGRLEDEGADENYDLDYLEDFEDNQPEPVKDSAPSQSNFLNHFSPKPARPQRSDNRPRPQGRVLDMRTGAEMTYDQEVVVMVPYDFEMTKVVCDHVRNGKTVICNIERIDDSTAQRVLDFILGATYALSGSLESISNKIFVVTPASTRLSVRTEESRKANRPGDRAYNLGQARREVRNFPRFTQPAQGTDAGRPASYYAEDAAAANQ